MFKKKKQKVKTEEEIEVEKEKTLTLEEALKNSGLGDEIINESAGIAIVCSPDNDFNKILLEQKYFFNKGWKIKRSNRNKLLLLIEKYSKEDRDYRSDYMSSDERNKALRELKDFISYLNI